MPSYLDSGFNENLIRSQYPDSMAQYDSVNISDIISGTSLGDQQISGLSASKIRAGIIAAITKLGDDSVVLDGEERRIIVNDGTNDRVLIGRLVGKF